MASNANLFFALFFLLLGIGLFVYEALTGRRLHMGNTELSLGWLAIAFFAFNLVRWWMWRTAHRRYLSKLERHHREKQTRQEEYLPEFDFSRSESVSPGPPPAPTVPDPHATAIMPAPETAHQTPPGQLRQDAPPPGPPAG